VTARELCALVSLCALAASPASAADEDSRKTDPQTGIQLRPALLDTSDGSGSTLGLEFEVHETPLSGKVNEIPVGDSIGDTIVGKAELKFDATGTVTADAKRNPKDLLDAALNGNYVLTTNSCGAFKVGGFGKYEADQSFDNRQFVYGVRGTYVKLGLLAGVAGDWVALKVSRGQVDPKADKDRQTALGTTELAKYYRNDLELVYHLNVRWAITSELTVESLELDYAYFLESSPPSQVEAAGLDRHHLATARVNFAKNLYVAYGKGTLPFDQQSSTIFEIGLHYKLQ
jgi:hypothetical protein